MTTSYLIQPTIHLILSTYHLPYLIQPIIYLILFNLSFTLSYSTYHLPYLIQPIIYLILFNLSFTLSYSTYHLAIELYLLTIFFFFVFSLFQLRKKLVFVVTFTSSIIRNLKRNLVKILDFE